MHQLVLDSFETPLCTELPHLTETHRTPDGDSSYVGIEHGRASARLACRTTTCTSSLRSFGSSR
jgi:hypothetical protein